MSLRQRQVDECLSRAFAGRPGVGKCKATVNQEGHVILYHYQHKLLVYDTKRRETLFRWHEKPTDLRILNAALAALADGIDTEASSSGRGAPPRESSATVATPTAPTERRGTFTVALGSTVEDRGSRFLALLAYPVASSRQASAALATLRGHPRFGGADHCISAFRASDGAEASEDDGEARAGGKLLRALKTAKASGVAVVVARWWGGVNLGKARFEHIVGCATNLLRAAGQRPGESMDKTNRLLGWLKSGTGHRLGGGSSSSGGRGGDGGGDADSRGAALDATTGPTTAGGQDGEAVGGGGGIDGGNGSDAQERRRRLAEAAERRMWTQTAVAVPGTLAKGTRAQEQSAPRVAQCAGSASMRRTETRERPQGDRVGDKRRSPQTLSVVLSGQGGGSTATSQSGGVSCKKQKRVISLVSDSDDDTATRRETA